MHRLLVILTPDALRARGNPLSKMGSLNSGREVHRAIHRNKELMLEFRPDKITLFFLGLELLNPTGRAIAFKLRNQEASQSFSPQIPDPTLFLAFFFFSLRFPGLKLQPGKHIIDKREKVVIIFRLSINRSVYY